jgi:hypothetical protein
MPGTFAYDAGTNTITVTGGTSGSPADFASMYAADQAGGWGVVTNPIPNVFQIACKINFGDGSTSTYFGDSQKVLVIPNGVATGNWNIIWQVKGNTTLRLGTLIDGTKKTTKNGCSIIFLEATYNSCFLILAYSLGATVQFYSLNFLSSTNRQYIQIQPCAVGSRIWNCLLSNLISLYNISSNNDIKNVTIQAANYGLLNVSCDCSNIFMTDCLYGIYLGGSGIFNFADLTIINLLSKLLYFSSYTGTAYIINSSVGTINSNQGGTNTGTVYFQKTFNLHVTDKDGNDISGSTVILQDKNGNEVFNTITDANGEIAFNGDDGSDTPNTVTIVELYFENNVATTDDRGPFVLGITKDGYQYYRNVIVIDRKMDLEVALLGAVAAGGVSPTNLGLVPLGIKQAAV